MGDSVDGIAKLAVHLAGGVDELDGAGDVNLTIVVRALRIRPGSTGSEVPTEGAELVKRPCPSYGGLGEFRRSRALSIFVAMMPLPVSTLLVNRVEATM